MAGRPEGRGPLGKQRLRWKDNIKMDLQQVGWGQLTGSCECGNEPSAYIKSWEFID